MKGKFQFACTILKNHTSKKARHYHPKEKKMIINPPFKAETL